MPDSVKLIVREACTDGYLLYEDSIGKVAFHHWDNMKSSPNGASWSISQIIQLPQHKQFDDMLSASKYLYGCLRRTPKQRYGLLMRADTGQVGFRYGDFTELRAFLFSSQSAIPCKQLPESMLTKPVTALCNQPEITGDKPAMDLFDRMKDKIKKEMPAYDEGKEDDADETMPKKVEKPQVASAQAFLEKYKQRAT